MATQPWLCVCAAVAALALRAYPAVAQRGGDVDCLAELGAVTVDGNLNVAGRCTLNGTEIRGGVTLFSGGSLRARDARIRGNLEGSRADFVDIERSRIDGRVRLDGLVGDASAIEQTEVNRNVELTANRTRFVILNNEVGGDLQASLNTGGVVISGNAIEEDLRCSLNLPAPVGVGNRVDGDARGQCANLQPEEPPPPPAPSPTPTPPPPTPSPPPAPTPTPTPSPPPSPPPTSNPPPATGQPELLTGDEEGGAGSVGWPAALLLALLAWRRRARR